MNCKHCNRAEMEPTASTDEYPDCNTWTCSKCGHVEPEIGSFKLDEADEYFDSMQSVSIVGEDGDRYRLTRGVK